jgi:hypothetical protein
MSLEKVSAFMQALGVAYFIWMGYQAPTSQQSTKDFLVAAFLGISLLLLLIRLFRQSPPQKPIDPSLPVTEREDTVDGTEDESTDFKQLFLDEQLSREKYQDQFVMVREERDQLKNELEQLKAQKPDTTLKDSDPKIEIEFRDERHRQGEDVYLTPVNRGQNWAKFVCLEPIPLREHTISFPTFSYYLAPVQGENMRPAVTRNDGIIDKTDFLAALYSEYDHIGNPKPYELIEPVIATYQDRVGNLFQTRCELVFNPSNHVDSTTSARGI